MTLTEFAAYCRKMVDAPAVIQRPKGCSAECTGVGNTQSIHEDCLWGWQSCGCTCHDDDRPAQPTDSERVLWARLADEIDHWLEYGLDDDPEIHTEPMWENA